MRWRSHLGMCGLVLAAVALAWVADWRRAAGPRPAPPVPPDELVVPARVGEATLVGYRHDGPPPWPAGNCFALAPDPGRPDGPRLRVANMHAEGLPGWPGTWGWGRSGSAGWGMPTALVIDPRVPRDWLLAEPCPHCTPPALRRELAAAHPDRFRPRAAAEPDVAPDRGGK